MGFRYRCQQCHNYQLCQDCFWRGHASGSHSNQHQMKEYTSWVRGGSRLAPHRGQLCPSGGSSRQGVATSRAAGGDQPPCLGSCTLGSWWESAEVGMVFSERGFGVPVTVHAVGQRSARGLGAVHQPHSKSPPSQGTHPWLFLFDMLLAACK